MISKNEALALAESRFPEGLEALAERLGAKVERSRLVGCDGWCITNGCAIFIRLNSQSSSARQRFTLAHELAHLILGTKPDIVLDAYSQNERALDSLAAELALPSSRLKTIIGNTLPVDAKCLQRVARAAHVSETMAACLGAIEARQSSGPKTLSASAEGWQRSSRFVAAGRQYSGSLHATIATGIGQPEIGRRAATGT